VEPPSPALDALPAQPAGKRPAHEAERLSSLSDDARSIRARGTQPPACDRLVRRRSACQRSRVPSDDKLLVRAYAPWGNAKAAGLTDKMWITAINGQQPANFGRGLLVWFRLRFEMGDPVTLTVIDPSGATKEIQYKSVKWSE